jgi:hypothetical protein
MSYILRENNGNVIGPFVDQAAAQTEAENLATTFASGEPSYTAKNDGSTNYIVVDLKDMSRPNPSVGNIVILNQREEIIKVWRVDTMTDP